jgi:hypothetical protein
LKLGTLVLAAPDIDVDVIIQKFVNMRLGQVPEVFAMYVCSRDKALGFSSWLAGFQEGFDANAPDKAGQKAAFDKMLALISDVKEGETLTFIYVPGKGTIVQSGDKELGVFEGKGFADAVFSIWLGKTPPTEDLKKGMLG